MSVYLQLTDAQSCYEAFENDEIMLNKKLTNWLGQAKRRANKLRPKAVGSGIIGTFLELR